jgi:hypothetical protein
MAASWINDKAQSDDVLVGPNKKAMQMHGLVI